MTTLHISTEVMPILVFATKPHQHFICTEAMPTFIFIMKPRQHSTLALALALKLHQYLHWNRANIHLCHKATSTLHSHQSRANIHEATSKLHLHWSHANIHETTSKPHLHKSHANIHLCYEVTLTLHISTEVVPTSIFAMKLRQHFIRTEAMPTFMKPRQYSICTKVMPTFIFVMKPCQYSTLELALALKLHWYGPL